jgi:MFS family permease
MKQIRVAAEYTTPHSPDNVELAAIERQQKRFFWLSIATMIVSFIHMVGALALFSDGSFWGAVATFLMTGLVDAATWVVTGYYDYAKRRKLKRGKLVASLLVVALVISCGLNLAYLITHMPATLPSLVGWSIAVAFAVFIPLCIAVASAERGQLEDDRTQYLQANPAPLVATYTTEDDNVATTLRQSAPVIRVVSRPPATMLRRRRQLPSPNPETLIGPVLTDKHAATIVAMRESTTPPMSYAKIGEHFGISGEAARQKYLAAKAQEGHQ